VIMNHINLFVNDFSLALGDTGKKALTELFRIAGEKGIIPRVPERIFLT
jgi:1,4-dihydroxy-6-naphthoate synthase